MGSNRTGPRGLWDMATWQCGHQGAAQGGERTTCPSPCSDAARTGSRRKRAATSFIGLRPQHQRTTMLNCGATARSRTYNAWSRKYGLEVRISVASSAKARSSHLTRNYGGNCGQHGWVAAQPVGWVDQHGWVAAPHSTVG